METNGTLPLNQTKQRQKNTLRVGILQSALAASRFARNTETPYNRVAKASGLGLADGSNLRKMDFPTWHV
jgi:hypothetical protein